MMLMVLSSARSPDAPLGSSELMTKIKDDYVNNNKYGVSIDTTCTFNVISKFVTKCDQFSDFHEWEKSKVAIELSRCIFDGEKSRRFPQLCKGKLSNSELVNECVTLISQSPVWWTTYFGYLNTIDDICNRMSSELEEKRVHEAYSNLLEKIELLDNMIQGKNLKEVVSNEINKRVSKRMNKLMNTILQVTTKSETHMEERLNKFINRVSEMVQSNNADSNENFATISQILLDSKEQGVLLNRASIAKFAGIEQRIKLDREKLVTNITSTLTQSKEQIEDMRELVYASRHGTNQWNPLIIFRYLSNSLTLLALACASTIISKILGILSVTTLLELCFALIGTLFGNKLYTMLQ